MEYTVQKLARLAGVSARTLRFYDEMGLLKPARISQSGYRIYGEREVNLLQQILFFRALGLDLKTIASVMQSPDFDRVSALEGHLDALQAQRAQLDLLIENVHKTIAREKGQATMTDQEKFEGLKQRLVDENERQYGKEIRAAYGDETVDASNAKMMGMDKAQYDAMQAAAEAIHEKLAAAIAQGANPGGDAGKALALAHKAWLGYTWPTYSKEAHAGLVQMYLADERFTAYYDAVTPGAAQFLHDAVMAWQDSL